MGSNDSDWPPATATDLIEIYEVDIGRRYDVKADSVEPAPAERVPLPVIAQHAMRRWTLLFAALILIGLAAGDRARWMHSTWTDQNAAVTARTNRDLAAEIPPRPAAPLRSTPQPDRVARQQAGNGDRPNFGPKSDAVLHRAPTPRKGEHELRVRPAEARDAAFIPALPLLEQRPTRVPIPFPVPRPHATVEVHITEEGRVSAARVVGVSAPFYETPLLKAAYRWRYAPARRAGKPVPSMRVVRLALR